MYMYLGERKNFHGHKSRDEAGRMKRRGCAQASANDVYTRVRVIAM